MSCLKLKALRARIFCWSLQNLWMKSAVPCSLWKTLYFGVNTVVHLIQLPPPLVWIAWWAGRMAATRKLSAVGEDICYLTLQIWLSTLSSLMTCSFLNPPFFTWCFKSWYFEKFIVHASQLCHFVVSLPCWGSYSFSI